MTGTETHINFLISRRNLLIVLFLFFIGFLMIVFLKSSFKGFDYSVNQWVAINQNAFLTQISLIFHYMFDSLSMFVITALIAVYLFLKKLRRYAFLVAGSMIGEAILTSVLKMAIHSPRPSNAIILLNEFSFPSGHVTSVTVLFCLLSYFAWMNWKSLTPKICLILFLVIIALAVGFSRIYLNVHWFSDVLGAYLLGSFWFIFSVMLFEYAQTKKGIQTK